jgi:hypothetical protein
MTHVTKYGPNLLSHTIRIESVVGRQVEFFIFYAKIFYQQIPLWYPRECKKDAAGTGFVFWRR